MFDKKNSFLFVKFPKEKSVLASWNQQFMLVGAEFVAWSAQKKKSLAKCVQFSRALTAKSV